MADKDASGPGPASPAAAMNVVAIEERLRVDVEQQETATVRVRTIVHKDLKEIPAVVRRRVVTIERVVRSLRADTTTARRTGNLHCESDLTTEFMTTSMPPFLGLRRGARHVGSR